MLLVFYAGDYDGPVTKFFNNTQPNNFHAMRRRGSREGFIFFAWDFEHALLEEDEDRTGPFPPIGESSSKFNPQWLFERCQDNPEFRILLADRIQKHFTGDGVLTPAGARRRFDRRIAEIEPALVLESARWGGAGPRMGQFFNGFPGGGQMFSRDHDWRPEVRRMQDSYFPHRTAIVLDQMKTRGWPAPLPPPKVQRDADGSIRLAGGSGEIVYTLDGADPRKVGGAPAPDSAVFRSPVKLAPGAHLLARSHQGNQWGALVEVK
jgi:hypothetical protein